MLHTTSHPTWRLGSLHKVNIDIVQLPDCIIRMTKHPEVVPAYVAQLLQIHLVYTWGMERLDECMRVDWSAEGFRWSRFGREEDSAQEGERSRMREREGRRRFGDGRHYQRRGRSGTGVSHAVESGGRRQKRCRSRVEFEQDMEQLDDQLPGGHVPGFLV